jgi:hypothetical protein
MMNVPDLPREIALRVAVKALNDCAGPSGLIPTLMVFGTLPQLPMLQGRIGPYDGQHARERAINAAMSEYRKYVAERRIREALRSRESKSMAIKYQPGSEVLVYREETKLWMGPFQVVQHVEKVVTVQSLDPGGTPRVQRFNVAVVKPYVRETETPEEVAPPLPDQVLLTEILAPNDPRQYSDQFLEAKLRELEGLCKNGTWEEVWTHEVPSTAKRCVVVCPYHKGQEHSKRNFKGPFCRTGL